MLILVRGDATKYLLWHQAHQKSEQYFVSFSYSFVILSCVSLSVYLSFSLSIFRSVCNLFLVLITNLHIFWRIHDTMYSGEDKVW